MRKYFPVLISILIVAGAGMVVHQHKSSQISVSSMAFEGSFDRRNCSRQPQFLAKLRVPQPIAIDLSQDRYRGLAFLYGANLSRAVHPKAWERFDHFSTYALDPKGNMYLTPMPYISVKPSTFNLQKNIYRLDSVEGELDIWMSMDEVKAGSSNPFGLISLDYDCDDHTLWVSAIDESDYHAQRGVIYHIDIQSQTVLQRLEGVDALSVKLLKTERGKYLLVGSARDHRLYAYSIKDGVLDNNKITLLELSDANEHIRKIIVRGQNHLELQTIPFTYTLIAQTSEQGVRTNYNAYWHPPKNSWTLSKKEP